MPEIAILPAIALAFIVLDIVTGLAQAAANKRISSTKMREGLWHKSAYIIIMAMFALIDYAQGYMDLGYQIPMLSGVCVIISLMEIFSIAENACKLNPELSGSKIMSMLKANGEDGEDHEEE